MYTTAIAAVLAEYPADIVREVTDPRRGIQTKLNWLPTVAEVKKACEQLAAPRRQQAAYAAAVRRQLEERKRIEGPRQTVEEIRAEMAKRGIHLGRSGRGQIETPASAKAKLGLTDEQWNAIPDGPARK
jgi:hypothetical protein